ncbi:proteasome accessory factor B [Deinobacterium chartae]|uniref:Proteasome accessory factor B n=1 Tax=Deinobacterium chartae TaxID=521158 RepID=A0A841I787_9DEIO|nr:WYL domain-containing protein [Deinobacterium chartae]MBB6099685.1 proteasome accessory factor B [Deinobacterium chartae]
MNLDSDLPKSERLIRLLETLQYAQASPRDLLRRLQLPEHKLRSVQRDLKLLIERGDVERLPDNTYRRVRHGRTRLNPAEALAVYSAARLLFHHAAEYNEHYLSALEKLASDLPEPARTIALRANRSYRERPNRNISRGVELAAQAWLSQRYLRCRYQRPGKRPLDLELAIYFVEIGAQNRAAYAIGVNRAYPGSGIRVYKIGRMRDLTILPDAYTIPEDFDALQYLSGAWGIMTGPPIRVVLEFSANVAERVYEERLGCLVEPPHTLEDGRVRLTLEVGGWLELVPWVLGWGQSVEVKAPQELRAYVADQVRGAAGLYAQELHPAGAV